MNLFRQFIFDGSYYNSHSGRLFRCGTFRRVDRYPVRSPVTVDKRKVVEPVSPAEHLPGTGPFQMRELLGFLRVAERSFCKASLYGYGTNPMHGSSGRRHPRKLAL